MIPTPLAVVQLVGGWRFLFPVGPALPSGIWFFLGDDGDQYRLYRCPECGILSARYFCSFRCHRDNDPGAYDHD